MIASHESDRKHASPGPHSGIRSGAGAWLLAALVFVLGLLATFGAVRFEKAAEVRQQRAELGESAEQAIGAAARQFGQFETLINAGRALFAGSEEVRRDEWSRFSRTLLRQQDFAGLESLAWAPLVPADEYPDFVRRNQPGAPASLEPRPAGDRPHYCPLTYIEPAEFNRNAPGRDICQVEPMMNALARTRGQTELAMSDPLRLTDPDGTSRQGYVLVGWVEGRAGSRSGWIATAIAPQGLFSEVLAELPPGIAARIVDVTRSEEPSVARGSASEIEADESGRRLALERVFRGGTRDWRLELERPVRFGPTPRAIWATGITITVLLSVLLLNLLRTRSRAIRLAERMSGAWRQSEQRLESITNNIFEGIYRGHPEDGLLFANQALAEMFGFSTPDEMLQHAGPILYADPEQRDELLAFLEEDGYYREVEVEYVRVDGSRFIGVNNAVATFDEDGRILHFDGVIYDITARKEAEQKAHRLAHYDSLTGLPNRALFEKRIRQAVRDARREDSSLALLFMDLDHFKAINDSLGHGIGDEMLTAVGARLGRSLRGSDTVCRQGGDEFLVIMDGADREAAERCAQRILDLFGEPFVVGRHELRVTPSIGIAMFPSDADRAEELVRCADSAMYSAKDRGRATWEFYTAELDHRAHERLQLENDLRQALEKDELELHYQPIVDLSDGSIAGAEALLRWTHPTMGSISPARFIPIAEQSGLIVEIGDWVIDRACRQAAEWFANGQPAFPVSVNVSAMQFWRGKLDEVIRDALATTGLDPGVLELELTESIIMRDIDLTSRVLEELNELGVSLSIDDFGTGYSSLSYLKRFRIDKLKIDQSFIRDLTDSADDAAIVSAVASMASDLKLDVVAEGVETEDQVVLIREREIRYGQGFLFSPAVPVEEFRGLMERGAFDLPGDAKKPGSAG